MFTVDVKYIDVYRCVIPFPNIKYPLETLETLVCRTGFLHVGVPWDLLGISMDFMRMMGSWFIHHRGDDMGIPHLH